jgi:predicted DNA-binding transcriptional regulator AlpA
LAKWNRDFADGLSIMSSHCSQFHGLAEDPMNTARKLLSTQQAAEQLGVSRSYLEKKRLTGDGPRFAKLGARVVYDPNDLDIWVKNRLRSSTAECVAVG